jgi:hypothetical protein
MNWSKKNQIYLCIIIFFTSGLLAEEDLIDAAKSAIEVLGKTSQEFGHVPTGCSYCQFNSVEKAIDLSSKTVNAGFPMYDKNGAYSIFLKRSKNSPSKFVLEFVISKAMKCVDPVYFGNWCPADRTSIEPKTLVLEFGEFPKDLNEDQIFELQIVKKNKSDKSFDLNIHSINGPHIEIHKSKWFEFGSDFIIKEVQDQKKRDP